MFKLSVHTCLVLDPTENGAMTSAFICNTSSGCDGALLPTHPLDPKTSWQCQKCPHRIDEWETSLGKAEVHKKKNKNARDNFAVSNCNISRSLLSKYQGLFLAAKILSNV